MAIKPAGQTTGAAAAGYSAGYYGLPIEEEKERETGGATQCEEEEDKGRGMANFLLWAGGRRKGKV